jgi:hypothetical protein
LPPRNLCPDPAEESGDGGLIFTYGLAAERSDDLVLVVAASEHRLDQDELVALRGLGLRDDKFVLDGQSACCGMGCHCFNLLFASKKEGPDNGALEDLPAAICGNQ